MEGPTEFEKMTTEARKLQRDKQQALEHVVDLVEDGYVELLKLYVYTCRWKVMTEDDLVELCQPLPSGANFLQCTPATAARCFESFWTAELWDELLSVANTHRLHKYTTAGLRSNKKYYKKVKRERRFLFD